MSHKKSKKSWRIKRQHVIFLLLIAAVIFFALMFFVFQERSSVPKDGIYIASENPQQGDTVLIKINGGYPVVSGNFNGKNIAFFRDGKNSDWSAYVGVDADTVPGKYKIFVDAGGNNLEKEINVQAKKFLSVKMAISADLQSKGYTASAVVNNVVNNDNPALDGAIKNFTATPYFNGPFSFPLQNIKVSGFDFGEILKFQGYQMQHFGVDLKAGMDTNVYAVNDGKVVLAKSLSNYGKTIVVDHGLGIFSMYLHLDEFKVSEGGYVKKDQLIGLSGETGYAAGPHLHFSMRDNGVRIDPLLFIKETEGTKQSFGLASIRDAFLSIFSGKR